VDDLFNVYQYKGGKGIKAKPKFLWLTAFAIMGALWFYYKLGFSSIHIPRVGDFSIGWWYIPLFILVIVSTSNAVNLTDGLDGLAGGLLVFAFIAFGAIAYAKGLTMLALFCGILIGSLLAFLWNNVPPALFYMGDTGAGVRGHARSHRHDDQFPDRPVDCGWRLHHRDAFRHHPTGIKKMFRQKGVPDRPNSPPF
jgi:phospho-N-acetylmuramoyl-pentapeptide-transferase